MWEYNYTDELCHFGVKGMRWGHRKASIVSTQPRRLPTGAKDERPRNAWLDKKMDKYTRDRGINPNPELRKSEGGLVRVKNNKAKTKTKTKTSFKEKAKTGAYAAAGILATIGTIAAASAVLKKAGRSGTLAKVGDAYDSVTNIMSDIGMMLF